MITVITGKRGSGKSSLVKKIVGDKKAVWVQQYALNGAFWTSSHGVKADTKYIVIDEVSDITKVSELFEDILVIKQPQKHRYRITTPNVLLVMKDIPKMDISFTHIDCHIVYDNINCKMKKVK